MVMAHPRRVSLPDKTSPPAPATWRGGYDLRRMRTSFLFPMPSFWSGMGSVLDLSGHPGRYLFSRTGREADTRALYSDYRMIGQDIEEATRRFLLHHPEAASAAQEQLFDPDETEFKP